VKEHLAPALDLPFQLGLKRVPLAQKESVHVLLGGFPTRRCGFAWNVTYLAAGPLLRVALVFLSHEKCLLFAHCTRYPPLIVGPSP
jgi:hypothetical protein